MYSFLPGFPDVYNVASGLERLSCILPCIYHGASRSVGLPIYTQEALRHSPASMCMYIFLVGLPHCRASRLYTIWPPAWTGFHVSYRVFITGPPALSGFPYTQSKASGMDRLPCVCRSIQWASRIVGLPGYILYGLRHGPASMYLTVYLSPGLPLCRASHIHTIRPPA